MATLRKAKCYKKVTRAYTRKSKFKKKGFIKVTQPPKVVKFTMGETKRTFPNKIVLVSKEKFQIRHNALESCRTLLNRHLSKKLGNNGYSFKINRYPHHILRENKMLTGAGADRMQSGMSHSFGKAMGSAVQLKPGDVIFTVGVEDNQVEFARKVMDMARPRISGKVAVEVA